MFSEFMSTPLGTLAIKASNRVLLRIKFVEKISSANPNEITTKCKRQLQEYFANARRSFDLPLDLVGTEFQKSVWRELLKIKYGETCSYKDIALSIGNPKAVRAVGSANGMNLLPIIVPCHRVIGSNGNLAGFSLGTDKKAWLLKHEGSCFVP